MDQNKFAEFSRTVLIKFASRLKLRNPRNIMRFLNAFSVVNKIYSVDISLLTENKKSIIDKIKQYNFHDSRIFSPKLYLSILLIFQKSQIFKDDYLYNLILEKLDRIKQSHYIKNQHHSNFLLLEDILFNENLRSDKISNQISIELFYFALNYRVALYGKEIIIKNNISKLLKENYYIPQQKEFAFYPTYKTPIYSIHSSKKDSIERDYWASLILELINIQKLNLEEWNEILYEMEERAKYYLEFYQETRNLDINLQTYHSLMILNIINKNSIPNFEKVIMNYDNLELSSNLMIEITEFFDFSWEKIEWDNYQLEKEQEDRIMQYINLFKEINLFPVEITNWIEQFFYRKKNQEFNITEVSNFSDILNEYKDFEKIFYYAFIGAEENIFILPIEYIMENDYFLKEKKIFKIVFQIAFLKIFLNFFPVFQDLLREIYFSFDQITILNDNKGHKFLINEEDIVKFLVTYQEDSIQRLKFENERFINFLKKMKYEFKNIDLPKIEQIQSNYVVYPKALAKVDIKHGKVKGLRLTIDIRDLELKQQIHNIKDYFNSFFNKTCNIAQSNYQVREFLEDINGNKNMIEFLRGLYEEGYKHIIKIDIKSCTDRIQYPSMKYILINTLSDDFAQLIFNIATKYTIEFEDRRITPFRGIAQGNPLSSELYTYIILILIMGSLEEANIQEKKPIFLGFGDDILILSQEINVLNTIYPILVNNFRIMGWEFDTEKTILVSSIQEIPSNLQHIKHSNNFSSVGFQIDISDSLKIFLISDRIFRIQSQFYFNLAQIIQNLVDQEEGSFDRFIEAATQFQLDIQDFRSDPKYDFSLFDFLNEQYKEISSLLKFKINKNEKIDKIDIKKVCDKIINLIASLKVIPPSSPIEFDIFLYTDGAAEPNPGDAGIGIYSPTLNLKKKFYIGYKNNNEAEYCALFCALRILDEKNQLNKSIQVFSDSKIMVGHLNGNYYVRDKRLKELCNYIKQYERKIKRLKGQIRYNHIYGKMNEEADRLSREAIEDFHQNKGEKFLIKKQDIPQE